MTLDLYGSKKFYDFNLSEQNYISTTINLNDIKSRRVFDRRCQNEKFYSFHVSGKIKGVSK